MIPHFFDLQQGFTQIPNYFLDQIAPDLTPTELRAMLYIYRHTLGFQKLADTISYDQFIEGVTTHDGRRLDQGAGVSRRALVPALAALEKRGLINRRQPGRYAPVYIELRPVAPVTTPAVAPDPAEARPPVEARPAPASGPDELEAAPVPGQEAEDQQQAVQQVQNLRDVEAESPVDAQKIHLMNQKKDSKPKEINRAAADPALEEIRGKIPGISQREIMRCFAIAKSHGRDLAYLQRIMGYVSCNPTIHTPAAAFIALVKADADRSLAPVPQGRKASSPGPIDFDKYAQDNKPRPRPGPIDFSKYGPGGKYAHLNNNAPEELAGGYDAPIY